MQAVLEGAFADPVHDSQRVFRAILDALAQPGQARNLALPGPNGAGLPPELAAIMLALADHDTPIWLAHCYRLEEARGFIAFHCGAPLVNQSQRAAFAFAPSHDMPPLDALDPGSQDYPDRSTTLVLALPALTGGTPLTLRGPGIEHAMTIAPQGLPEDFAGQWAANRALFPRGVDLILAADGQVLGLPRSTRIAEA